MHIIASFNYHDPSPAALVTGALIGLFILVGLGFTRSIVAGLCGGMVTWGGIAFAVFGLGSGDLTGLMQFAAALFFGMIGGAAGAAVGAIGKHLGGGSEPGAVSNASGEFVAIRCDYCEIQGQGFAGDASRGIKCPKCGKIMKIGP